MMKPDPSTRSLPSHLDEWFDEHPGADRSRLEEVWSIVEKARFELTDADRQRRAQVWSTLEKHIGREERAAVRRPGLRLYRSHAFRWMAAAAVFAILVGVGYFFRTTSVTVPRGEIAEVTLPDGSTVQLNSESVISYRPHSIGSRIVRLEGEAYFDVVPNERRFVVETFNARTTVLGTEFNVRARSDEPQASTSVVVASGKVRLLSKNGDQEGVVLTSGTHSSVSMNAPRPTFPEVVPLSRRLAWRTGGLAFSDQPFSVIFKEIERRFDVHIQAPDDILSRPFSYYVHNPGSAAEVISDLVTAEGLRYRKTAQGFDVHHP